MSNLKKHRMENYLSQYELADLTGVPRHKIQVAENGIAVLTESEAMKITKILGCIEIPEYLKKLVVEADDE